MADDDDETGAGDGPDDEPIVDGWPVSELLPILAGSQAEFVAARTARVKALKAAGDRDGARALAKLRKPSRLVWTVGQIAREDPELASEATAAAENAEAATAGAGDLRNVLESFRALVARAASAGAALDRSVDRASVELALREVLSDPTSRRDWALGCLLALPSDRVQPADELAPRRARRQAEKAAAARRAGGADDVAGDAADADADTEVDAEVDTDADAGPGSPDGRARKTAAETTAERRKRKAAEAAREARRREHKRALAAAHKLEAKLSDRRAHAADALAVAQSTVDDLQARLAELEAEAELARVQVAAREDELATADAELSEARTDLDALGSDADDA